MKGPRTFSLKDWHFRKDLARALFQLGKGIASHPSALAIYHVFLKKEETIGIRAQVSLP
jgi:hypothetical protein